MGMGCGTSAGLLSCQHLEGVNRRHLIRTIEGFVIPLKGELLRVKEQAALLGEEIKSLLEKGAITRRRRLNNISGQKEEQL